MAATVIIFAVFNAAAEEQAKPQRIMLWPDSPDRPSAITVHLPKEGNGTAFIICPGGGYGGLVTGAEGHGIAKWLNENGIAGIVLEYELPKGHATVPWRDAQRAIRFTRANADKWKIRKDQIGIIGFSAGGHVASTAGTNYDAGNAKSDDPVERMSSRPDFMILVYPVISMGEKAHAGSKRNLLGKEPSKTLVKSFSNETQVTYDTPPTFLAHAKDDRVVPPDHSRMFADALKKYGVEYKYLELPSGGHGLNGYKGPQWDAWQIESLKWLKSI